MARVAPVLTCTAEERTTLTQFGPNRSEEARLVGCARIFLLCLDGKRNEEVARELWVRSSTVGVRRQRCAEQGLRDRHRSGRPSWRELRTRILTQLSQPPSPVGLNCVQGLRAKTGGTSRGDGEEEPIFPASNHPGPDPCTEPVAEGKTSIPSDT